MSLGCAAMCEMVCTLSKVHRERRERRLEFSPRWYRLVTDAIGGVCVWARRQRGLNVRHTAGADSINDPITRICVGFVTHLCNGNAQSASCNA